MSTPLPVRVTGEGFAGDRPDGYLETAERAARGVPTPVPAAVAYTLSLLTLIALATALIACGRF
ncbi:hypothetical protein ACPC54_37950 [Kitasatospora sp. NPDC094028]